MSTTSERIRIRGEILHHRKKLIPELKKALEESKRARKARVKRCRDECKVRKREARIRATRARKKLSEHLKKFHRNAVTICEGCLDENRAGLQEINKALDNLRHETDHLKKLRIEYRALKSTRGVKGGRRSAELRAESDDQVRRDLGGDKELEQLWKQVKGKIKPSKKMTRTEAFFQYVHDHSDALEALRTANEDRYEKELEKLYKDRANLNSEQQLDEAESKITALKASLKRCEDKIAVPF